MEFFQTGMGRQFFESTMPRLVKALERLTAPQQAEQAITLTLLDDGSQAPAKPFGEEGFKIVGSHLWQPTEGPYQGKTMLVTVWERLIQKST